jgi:hypothetical protein
MREEAKKVFYCDFCKKHSLSKGSLAKHEKHCTANINRHCRLCDELNGGQQDIKPIVEKWKGLATGTEQEPAKLDGKKLLEDVEGCPMCALTVIRLSGVNKYPNVLDGFDFKGELASAWSIINDANNSNIGM